MKREELISKWLDHNLNDQELEAFKTLEDYDDLVKLNKNMQSFKADTYNISPRGNHSAHPFSIDKNPNFIKMNNRTIQPLLLSKNISNRIMINT